MFSFFKKKNEDEGVLSNLKTVTRWVQELPAGDIYSAQEKVVQNLIQFNHEKTNFSKDRLQILMHLDESTRDMQSSLCLQYLRNARMSKAIESKLWIAIHAFYWEITRGYHSFLMDFVANPGGSKIQALIPLLTARAVRGFSDIIKWRYFRYEQPDEKLWLRLHNLYRIAEFDNFSSTNVTVYKTDALQHSPAEEYGQALLLSLFGSGSLVPREIEMVDQWLDHWSDMIKVDTLYNPDIHTFYIDTSKGYGLRRCRNQVSDPTLRFMSTTLLLHHLKGVVESLKSGSSPAELGLSEDFRLPEGYSLINQVEKEWNTLKNRERRATPRTAKSGQWKVIHGLGNICNELSKTEIQAKASQAQLSPEEILDIKLYGFVTERTKDRQIELQRNAAPAKHELWEQVDGSEQGLGFSINQSASQWVKVGNLIALCPLEDDQWELGIVTRLARKDEGNRVSGVKLFSGDFHPITLKQDSADSGLSYVVDEPGQPTGGHNVKAIMLSDAEDNERLLIDGASYARNRRYQLRSPFGPTRLIRLESVEDSGESWLKVKFEVIAA
jgi:hypothetical protein